MSTKLNDPLPADKERMVRLVKGVVLAQGNLFIKELLRHRGIKIGATKADFERNLVEAIRSGELQPQHIESWLDEVEGWGNQHVYLFKISRTVAGDEAWTDPGKMQSKIIGAGFKKQWNAPASLEYPRTHTLTGINFTEGALRFIWHKGLDYWLRDKTKDYPEEIDGDVFEFRAHRLRAERAVTRFEIRPNDGLVAMFVQVAVNEEEHKTVVDDVRRTVQRIWEFDNFDLFPIPNAIKKLDARALEGGDVRANVTRLSSEGAYVEFGATSVRHGYKDFTPVREVRRAVRQNRFSGLNGNFMLPTAVSDREQREIRVQLYGAQRRVKLASQMTAPEVWSILSLIMETA